MNLTTGTVVAAALGAAAAQGATNARDEPARPGGGSPLMFDDPLYEGEARRTLATTPYGGADIGECLVTAGRIVAGDADSWHREWSATADRIYALAAASAERGHGVSAREAYLRAANYYRTSYIFLYGEPVDPRLVAAFDREVEAFLKAAALFEPAIEPVEIPFEGTTLPGYFYRADDSGEPRPTVIATNGYDSTIQEMHFAHAVAAVRRGYHCLLFDGPGQGRVLFKQGLHLRPDWESVVRPVVDFALARPEVDPERLALVGWSFGGYLAPRAAAGEPRIRALVADPGQWDLLEAMKRAFATLPQAPLEHPESATDAELQPYLDYVMGNPHLRWSVVQRGFWVHGVGSFREYLRSAAQFRLSTVVEAIACPTLIVQAENDPVAAFAGVLYDALRSPKTLIRFSAAEGAGDHTELLARTLYHQKTFDWLDEVFDHTPDRTRAGQGG